MRAREAAAARGRDAAAAASAMHAENLQELQTLRTPEELAADAAADLHDMITGASESQQAARARAKTRALREKERQNKQSSVLLLESRCKSCATTKPFVSWRYVVRDREVRWICLIVRCFRMQRNVNVA